MTATLYSLLIVSLVCRKMRKSQQDLCGLFFLSRYLLLACGFMREFYYQTFKIAFPAVTFFTSLLLQVNGSKNMPRLNMQ